MANESKHAEAGAEAGFRFPYDKESRTWSVVKVTMKGDQEVLKTVSTGHRSMGQARKSLLPQSEADAPPA